MKNFIIILIALSLCSCSTLSKTFHRTKVETENEQTQKHKESEVSKTSDKTNTQSTTTITEKADTNIQIPGAKASLAAPLNQLVKGDTATSETNGITIRTSYDPLTGTIRTHATIEPISVPIRIDRSVTHTESENSTKEAEIAKKEESYSHTKSDSAATETKRTKVVEKSPWFSFWWVFILVAIGILLFFLKKLSPRL